MCLPAIEDVNHLLKFFKLEQMVWSSAQASDSGAWR